MEENQNVAIDSPVYYPILEEKVDKIISYQNAQYGLSLFVIGCIASILVFYLLYKFISKFFEF